MSECTGATAEPSVGTDRGGGNSRASLAPGCAGAYGRGCGRGAGGFGVLPGDSVEAERAGLDPSPGSQILLAGLRCLVAGLGAGPWGPVPRTRERTRERAGGADAAAEPAGAVGTDAAEAAGAGAAGTNAARAAGAAGADAAERDAAGRDAASADRAASGAADAGPPGQAATSGVTAAATGGAVAARFCLASVPRSRSATTPATAPATVPAPGLRRCGGRWLCHTWAATTTWSFSLSGVSRHHTRGSVR